MTQGIMIGFPHPRNKAGGMMGLIIMTTPNDQQATEPKMAETVDEAIAEMERFKDGVRKGREVFLSSKKPFGVSVAVSDARERIAEREAHSVSPNEQLERILFAEVLQETRGASLTATMRKKRQEHKLG